MRPKKRILLCCEHPLTASVMRFTLDTRGYNATLVETLAEAVTEIVAELGREPEFDVVLVVRYTDSDESLDVLDEVRRRGLRSVLLYREKDMVPPDVNADVTLPMSVCAAEWLERLRILCCRKPGPKKRELVAA